MVMVADVKSWIHVNWIKKVQIMSNKDSIMSD